MSDIYTVSARAQIGTAGNDTLEAGYSANGFDVIVARDGDDTLYAHYGRDHIASLGGGGGNDTYYADAMVTEIIDTSGYDTLYLPGYSDEFEGAFVQGRDLFLVNLYTGQSVVVVDFKEAGRIEQMIDLAGNRFSADQVQSMVYNQSLGDISYWELEYYSGISMPSESDYNAGREIDIAMQRLSWDNVFQHLSERGSTDNNAIADAIQYEIMPLLSSSAQQLWHSAGAYQALLDSEYDGIEANVNLPEKHPVARSVVEQVALLYEAALDRAPDVEGVNYWIDRAEEGHGVIDIAGYFLMSDEFQQLIGGNNSSDSQYLDQVYLNVLDRQADAAGHNYWADQMDNGLTRQEILFYFADSPENRDNADWLAGLTETDNGNWLIV